MIFNVQRYSTHDGEGIRTIIFYKGCTLRCQWCSNPESQSFLPEILFDPRLCKRFGDCNAAVPGITTPVNNSLQINRAVSADPEILRNRCITKALIIAGEKKTTDEIIFEIEKDIPFYRQSNGGVTLSGGEPLAQGKELTVLLKELKKRNISVSVETSLHINWNKIQRCRGLITHYLVDLKHTDPVKFTRYTGGKLDLVLSNLVKLVDSGENITIRIPVIPDFNHTGIEIRAMIDYIVALGRVKEVHFIPYHMLGIGKYNMLGMEYFGPKHPVAHSELDVYTAYAHSKGLKTRTGG